jgi:hypothetical protein
MIREVNRFLHETWQLFYWSLFLPSQLQQRMNKLSPQQIGQERQKDTSGGDILAVLPNSHFVFQYLFLSVILSLPLAALVALSGRGWDFQFWLGALFISHALSMQFLPSGIGFGSFLLLALIYLQQAELFATAFRSLLEKLPPPPQLLMHVSLGGYFLFAAIALFFFATYKDHEKQFSNQYSKHVDFFVISCGNRWR